MIEIEEVISMGKRSRSDEGSLVDEPDEGETMEVEIHILVQDIWKSFSHI